MRSKYNNEPVNSFSAINICLAFFSGYGFSHIHRLAVFINCIYQYEISCLRPNNVSVLQEDSFIQYTLLLFSKYYFLHSYVPTFPHLYA